jgi:hypothetical protein
MLMWSKVCGEEIKVEKMFMRSLNPSTHYSTIRDIRYSRISIDNSPASASDWTSWIIVN